MNECLYVCTYVGLASMYLCEDKKKKKGEARKQIEEEEEFGFSDDDTEVKKAWHFFRLFDIHRDVRTGETTRSECCDPSWPNTSERQSCWPHKLQKCWPACRRRAKTIEESICKTYK